MEHQPNTLKHLFENAGDYLETRLELLKLQAINKSSEVASSLFSNIIILVLILFVVFLVNIGLALWVGQLLGKMYLGFFVIGGLYALIALLLHLFKNSWLKEPVSTIIIKKMLN